ncbi:MAG: DUF5683 domain-containing protein [Bacteroidales bacterium]|nr:DUF5683 domain-containing protein [Bacteroidales bacterium]
MVRRILLLLGFAILFGLHDMKAQVIVFDTLNQPIKAETIITANAKDNVKVPKARKPHSAKKATIMSACLPGLGQIYNGKWWKVPIVYAGLGGLGYMAYNNYYEYNSYLNAYKYVSDPQSIENPLTEYEQQLAQRYQASQLQTYKESYRHDFELYTIILVAWYGVNIIDACVDGHLYTYDISDDLSFNIDPMIATERTPLNPGMPLAQAGLSFKLTF